MKYWRENKLEEPNEIQTWVPPFSVLDPYPRAITVRVGPGFTCNEKMNENAGKGKLRTTIKSMHVCVARGL